MQLEESLIILWDFIKVSNYLYPMLHGEIGLTNGVLDSFYDFLDKVEALMDKERTVRNDAMVADV